MSRSDVLDKRKENLDWVVEEKLWKRVGGQRGKKRKERPLREEGGFCFGGFCFGRGRC